MWSFLESRQLVLRKSIVFFCLLLLAVVEASRAQVVARQDTAAKLQSQHSGTWSATTGTGLPLQGTWTAVVNLADSTVTGTWAIVDALGRTPAQGAWSASKSRTQWIGAWRAVTAGRDGEFSGTWSTGVDLKANASFVDLFAKAVETVVSGIWRSGTSSGPWAIRAAKQESRP